MTHATCDHCGQTLTGAPDTSGAKLRVENCVRCGTSNWVADTRPAEAEGAPCEGDRDAGRLEEEIRRSVMRPRYGVEETADDKAERAETWRVLEAKIEALGPLEIYAVVKPAFPYTRYGM